MPPSQSSCVVISSAIIRQLTNTHVILSTSRISTDNLSNVLMLQRRRKSSLSLSLRQSRWRKHVLYWVMSLRAKDLKITDQKSMRLAMNMHYDEPWRWVDCDDICPWSLTFWTILLLLDKKIPVTWDFDAVVHYIVSWYWYSVELVL